MSVYTYQPVGMSLDAMLKQIAEDQCETLWRCDLAALGEKVFDLDIYRHGASAPTGRVRAWRCANCTGHDGDPGRRSKPGLPE